MKMISYIKKNSKYQKDNDLAYFPFDLHLALSRPSKDSNLAVWEQVFNMEHFQTTK